MPGHCAALQHSGCNAQHAQVCGVFFLSCCWVLPFPGVLRQLRLGCGKLATVYALPSATVLRPAAALHAVRGPRNVWPNCLSQRLRPCPVVLCSALQPYMLYVGREILHQASLCHPFIVQLFEAFLTPQHLAM